MRESIDLSYITLKISLMPVIKISFRAFLLLVLLSSFSVVFSSSTQADDPQWRPVKIPEAGVGGNWVLAPGSDIRHLVRADDGTLYCYANPQDTDYRLFKSVDGGYNWCYTGRVTEEIVDIAVVSGNPELVYYATISKVYKSADEGVNFNEIITVPGAGPDLVEITAIDAVHVEGNTSLLIATCHGASGEYGGVYLLSEDSPTGLINTGLTDLDVYTAIFSPNFASDGQIIAVGFDETDTVITTRFEGQDWGTSVGNARLTNLPLESAVLAFPDDYCSDPSLDRYTQFIAINSGNGQGDVYRLEGRTMPLASSIIDLDAGSVSGMDEVDITGLAVCGSLESCSILAGAGNAAAVYYSADAGDHWTEDLKPPSGERDTCVLMVPDFVSSSLAYAVTSGRESAFSISRDKGRSWNQISLVDTRVTSILDLAISPAYSQDNTLLLLTADIQSSLWKSSSGGLRWERVFHSSPAVPERASLVMVSPEYAVNEKIFLAGSSQGNPVIWKSEDNGRSFTKYYSTDPETGSPVEINAWTIAPGDLIFVASFDGDNGLVYQTGGDGLNYTDVATAGGNVLNTLEFWPDYGNEGAVLAGSIDGYVYFSEDGGKVFEALPYGSTQAPLAGAVTVAFDSGFSQNKTIYAASSEANSGIHRFVVGASSAYWESVDSTLPVGTKIGQLVSSHGGLLYAVNMQAVNNSQRKGGIERSINPAAQTPVFETVTSGLNDGIILKMLRVQGSNLWTVIVDLNTTRLLSCTDSLTTPVGLVSPADMTTGLDTRGVKIAWEVLSGATRYHWQVDTDQNFAVIPSGLEGRTDSLFQTLPSLDPDTTYYWRVRADQPVTSPWSAIRSFSTKVSSPNSPVIPGPGVDPEPLAVPRLTEPGSAKPVSINPVFKWSATGADRYILVVSKSDAFTDLVIDKSGSSACNTNVWICDMALEYDTAYYWKVRAVYGSQVSDWSGAGIFVTEKAPDDLSPVLPAPKLKEPGINDICSSLPLFLWTACEGAERYEIMISGDDTFLNPLIDKRGDEACYSNIWQCDTELDYGSRYYWKVRAVKGELTGTWSDVSTFITRGLSAATSSPPGTVTVPGPSETPLLTGNTEEPEATPAITEGPASGTPSATASYPPVTDSPDSTVRLLVFLVGGLAVLTAALIAVVVVMLRKFRQY